MIRVVKDPLILDRLLENYEPILVKTFCLMMAEIASDNQCWSDAEWWIEAAHYVTDKQIKSDENSTIEL